MQPTPDTAQTFQRLGLSVGAYATFTLALLIASAFLCFTLSAVIFWGRSDDWMALLVALVVVAPVTFNVPFALFSQPAWQVLAIVLSVLGLGVFLLVISLFPDGRFVPRWTRWLLPCWVVVGIVFLFSGGLGLIRGNQLAIIASTFLIGALFKPVRDRTQKLIDRRFYRRKYDAAKTLATFNTTIRDEVDLNQLCTKLMAVVDETMQPAHVSLWLCPHKRYIEETTRALPFIDTVGKP